MPLYPSGSPAARTRAERFDALVLEALEPIEADEAGARVENVGTVDEVVSRAIAAIGQGW